MFTILYPACLFIASRPKFSQSAVTGWIWPSPNFSRGRARRWCEDRCAFWPPAQAGCRASASEQHRLTPAPPTPSWSHSSSSSAPTTSPRPPSSSSPSPPKRATEPLAFYRPFHFNADDVARRHHSFFLFSLLSISIIKSIFMLYFYLKEFDS